MSGNATAGGGSNTIRPGFFGKLPARGDFVGAGLSPDLVSAWHGWMAQRLSESREQLQDDWKTLWLVAPVWRFALPPLHCGPRAVTGLFMPSVDKVGRYFPLMAGVEGAGAGRDPADADASSFHDGVESVCRWALEQDWAPDRVLASLSVVAAPTDAPARIGLWWTEGGPHVAAGSFEATALPDGARFQQMLRS